MRAVVVWLVVALAGCGRFGFGGDAPIDATPDGPGDAAIDAQVIPGLVARYAMDDDPSDGVIDDATGNGRSARCVVGGSCPTQVAGHRGMGLQFNGTTQLARISNDAVFAMPNGFTIAVWIYLDDNSVDRVAVAKPHGPSSDDTWAFVTWAADTCLETTAAVGNQNACSGFPAPLGRWVHFAGTWNGVEKVFHIDGVRVGQNVTTDAVVFDSHDIVIGADENSGVPIYRWAGAIDELAIFDRALTTAEITMLAAP